MDRWGIVLVVVAIVGMALSVYINYVYKAGRREFGDAIVPFVTTVLSPIAFGACFGRGMELELSWSGIYMSSICTSGAFGLFSFALAFSVLALGRSGAYYFGSGR